MHKELLLSVLLNAICAQKRENPQSISALRNAKCVDSSKTNIYTYINNICIRICILRSEALQVHIASHLAYAFAYALLITLTLIVLYYPKEMKSSNLSYNKYIYLLTASVVCTITIMRMHLSEVNQGKCFQFFNHRPCKSESTCSNCLNNYMCITQDVGSTAITHLRLMSCLAKQSNHWLIYSVFLVLDSEHQKN